MPLYEYQCKRCQHRFEKIQSFSDQPVRKCPQCKGPVEKLLSAPAVQFKGTGWYATDYASKSLKPAETSGAETSASESTKGSDNPKAEKTETRKAETKKKK
jgi:putative FmdB family regulatory protein